MDLQAYDILQISRDNGEHWLDFTTLRDARDFRLAQSLVTGGQWNGESVLFRVVRWAPTAMDSRGFTVLAETTPNVDDEPPTETTPQDLSLSPQAKAKQMSFDLETMIDKTSLAQVLDLIAEICALKAEHISENWGDKRLAHDWRSAGKRVDALTTQQPVARVSWHHREENDAKPGKCLLCGERLDADQFPGSRHNCGATIYPKSEAR